MKKALLCLAVLSSAGLGCQCTAVRAAASDAVLDGARLRLSDDKAYAAELQRIIDSEGDPPLRMGALRRLLKLRAGGDAGQNAELCVRLIKDANTLDTLLSVCAAEAARAEFVKLGSLSEGASSLRERFKDLPDKQRQIVETAAAKMAAMKLTPIDLTFKNLRPLALSFDAMFLSANTAISDQIFRNLIADARSAEDKKDLPRMRTRLTEIIHSLPHVDSAEVNDAILRLLKYENSEKVLSENSARQFVTFISENATNPERVESAEFFLSQAFFKAGLHERALDSAQKFQARYPARSRARQAQLVEGNALVLLGNNEKAIAIFQLLLDNKDSEPAVVEKALFLTGWTYLFSQDVPNAKKYLGQIIAKFPDSVSSKKAQELLSRLPKD